jgi:hypothetical protein
MSLTGEAAERALGRSASRLDSAPAAIPYRLPVYAACTALALLINYLIGKDAGWDTLNYHLYAGFSALHDRFAQDYFAAGPQTYANPYAYVPYYALVTSGLSALQSASVLAVAHSVILWITFELALTAYPSDTGLSRSSFAVLAVALAALNPILIQQIGSSFSDITTAELVLGGWLLLAKAIRTPSSARVILAAALLGAATAFKLTNAVHAVAAAVIVMTLPSSPLGKVRYGTCYAAALAVTFAIVTAPWSYRLEERFGNPFFPLLNNVFRSPEFTTEPLRHYRFIPSSLIEGLWRPFAMLDPTSGVHEELRAPDARYAVLAVLLGVVLAQWLWGRFNRRRQPTTGDPGDPTSLDRRVMFALGCAFLADWIAWLAESGNSRYFLAMSCVGSVLIVGLLSQAFAARPKVRNYVLVALFAVQSTQLVMGTDLRWNGVPWNGGKWFEIELPQALTSESDLYLSMGVQSNSFLAPYLPSGAGLIDFSGGYPLTESGANGAQVKALIRRFTPHLRLLISGERLYADAERRSPSISEVNGALARFGLRADTGDCATISVRNLPPVLEFTFASSVPRDRRPADTTYLVSCRVFPDETGVPAAIAHERAASIVLDRLEDACPQLFQPHRLPTDVRGDLAQRLYINTDLVAWVRSGWVKFVDPTRGDPMVLLGRESDWITAPPRLVCGRRNGHYFARLLGAHEPR